MCLLLPSTSWCLFLSVVSLMKILISNSLQSIHRDNGNSPWIWDSWIKSFYSPVCCSPSDQVYPFSPHHRSQLLIRVEMKSEELFNMQHSLCWPACSLQLLKAGICQTVDVSITQQKVLSVSSWLFLPFLLLG